VQYRSLGRDGLKVSSISLGTMTFGQQNTETEGHRLMDIAVDAGVTMLDAAELYPITPTADTQGRTEEIIGTWMAARKNRDKVIVASKVVGKSPAMPWFRGPDHRLDAANIRAALDGSLKRLRTDYIDLYYLHWPDRQSNRFGKLGYVHDPDDDFTPLEESLEALAEQVQAGKVRHIAISNETPWGLHTFLKLAEAKGLPRVCAVQNPYSLLNRSYEVGLAEMSIREDAPLVAYAPLAGGVLTGKYAHGARPEGARITLWPERYSRYMTPAAQLATDQYVALARAAGLDPAQMALAFCLRQPFLGSAIVGATTEAQLRNNLAAHDLTLSDDLVAAIEAVHTAHPNPAP